MLTSSFVRLLLAMLAWTTLSPPGLDIPMRVTPIEDLGAPEGVRHAEVLQVRRDFGQPHVNVALDAWMPERAPRRIEAVRVWWSDPVDRFPFSEQARRHLDLDYRRLGPSDWKISVVGDDKRFTFDVALHQGRPAAFADVVLPDGRVVPRCRATTAQLYARRFLRIPVGVHSMIVTCTAPDGTIHRAPVRTVELD